MEHHWKKHRFLGTTQFPPGINIGGWKSRGGRIGNESFYDVRKHPQKAVFRWPVNRFRMPKVHPNTSPEADRQVSDNQVPSGPLVWRKSPNASPEAERRVADSQAPEPLTVWRKSLLFNCNGFTVFDAKGSLVFRVDNYLAGNSGNILLMDGGGKPLLTIRRKGISFGCHWLIFNGEEAVNPRFSVTKPAHLFTSKTIARVSAACGPRHIAYVIEGSYTRRSCVIYDSKRRLMAEIQRKEGVGGVAYGEDIFRFVIQPEFEMPIAMSLVIILEQMFRVCRLI